MEVKAGARCQGPSFIPLPAYLLYDLGKSCPFSEAQFSHLRRGVMTTPPCGFLSNAKSDGLAAVKSCTRGILLAVGVSLSFCWGRSPHQRKRPHFYYLI